MSLDISTGAAAAVARRRRRRRRRKQMTNEFPSPLRYFQSRGRFWGILLEFLFLFSCFFLFGFYGPAPHYNNKKKAFYWVFFGCFITGFSMARNYFSSSFLWRLERLERTPTFQVVVVVFFRFDFDFFVFSSFFWLFLKIGCSKRKCSVALGALMKTDHCLIWTKMCYPKIIFFGEMMCIMGIIKFEWVFT